MILLCYFYMLYSYVDGKKLNVLPQDKHTSHLKWLVFYASLKHTFEINYYITWCWKPTFGWFVAELSPNAGSVFFGYFFYWLATATILTILMLNTVLTFTYKFVTTFTNLWKQIETAIYKFMSLQQCALLTIPEHLNITKLVTMQGNWEDCYSPYIRGLFSLIDIF